jgi:peptide/nickel transport system substrate-binding protein
LREITVAVPSVIGWPAEETGANGETPQVCFDSFLRGDVDGNIYPWLAKSYKMAADNTYITFELRDDVSFHDGSHLNAAVAKWNLDNQITAKQQPFWNNVEVTGEYGIKINFKQWRNTMFAAFVDGPATWMCSKEAFDKNGIDWMRKNPVGTGPFKFVSFARDTSFVAEKNPNWWNKANGPYVDRYEILYVTDPTTQLSMMKVGDGDFVSLEPGKMAADLKNIGCELTTGIVSVFAIVPDTGNADSIWADAKFREAVEYSINRESIAKNLGYGFLAEPNQLPPRGNPNYDSNYAGRKYDPAKAKELLAQSSYKSTTPVKIIVSPLAPNKDAILAVQSYMSAAGINVELDFPEWSKFVTYLNGTWASGAALFQVFPVIGGANYNSTLAWYLDPTSGRLKSWKATQAWIDMLNAACLTPQVDPALTRKCLNYIQDNALILPVHESGRSYAYMPYVKGGDWMKRSMSSWKNIDKIWLDK